jgi:hypothetical protein
MLFELTNCNLKLITSFGDVNQHTRENPSGRFFKKVSFEKNEVKKVKHYKKLKICQMFTEMAGKVEFPGQSIASLPSDVLVSTLQVQVL